MQPAGYTPRTMPYEHPWAIYDIRIRTERLELRLPTDDDLMEMLDRAQSGIHDPGEMPFGMAWTDQPSPWFERSFMQFHWGSRANWSPGKWSLDLGVWAEGRLVGTQGMGAENFGVLRTVSTGSWIAREFQGQGIGKEMRSAVLGFTFDTLGGEWATSGSFLDNHASAAVSRALGYDEDGFRGSRAAWRAKAAHPLAHVARAVVLARAAVGRSHRHGPLLGSVRPA